MAPTSAYMIQNDYDEPISRTYQYRKVMKPMLERKRRARINRCLDELKELMVTALQSEGENVSKLEKADILELTVRHLHQLKRQHQLINSTPEQSYADRFRAGFTHCAAEVSHFLSASSTKDNNSSVQSTTNVVDPMASAKLLQHLSTCIRHLENNNIQNQQLLHPSSTINQPQFYKHQQYTPPSSPVLLVQNQQPVVYKQNQTVTYSTVKSTKQPVIVSNTSATMWRPW